MRTSGVESDTKDRMSLAVNNLHVSVDKKEILHGVDITVEKGTVHAIMGPNGSGKSTLANAVMGHPKYTITSGQIFLNGEDITHAKVNEKAKKGLFLSMQYPPEIAGVSLTNLLRTSVAALSGVKQHPIQFHQALLKKIEELGIDPSFAGRSVHAGSSGGEKKRLEILQLLVLNPTYAILDETDSGLDVDALRVVADGINRFRSSEHGVLLITHYNRILEYVQPDVVHIMKDGRIVESGGKELAKKIEQEGYANA
jgi:Fe-S cluster assembly ATP-binding protein